MCSPGEVLAKKDRNDLHLNAMVLNDGRKKDESGKSMEFFLRQCRVSASQYRVKELPLNKVPQWQGGRRWLEA